MEVDYLKLSEQYASFLVAAGGVSITVLTLVLTFGLESAYGRDLRTYLAAALVVAIISCFTGAHLMAETAAFISHSRIILAPLSGERLFLLAGINIFIAVTLIIFALMLLPLASGKVNTVDIQMIKPICISVFVFVIAAVVCWLVFSVTIRSPRVQGCSAVLMFITVVILGVLWGSLLYKYTEYLLHMTFFLIVALTFLTLFIFTLTFKDGKEANYYEINFFILAITLTCISLTGASFKLMLR